MAREPVNRYVDVTIAGRRHRLRMNHAAIDAFERESGASLVKLALNPQEIATSVRVQGLLLWAALLDESGGLLSPRDVSAMLDDHAEQNDGDKTELFTALGRALELSEVFPRRRPAPEAAGGKGPGGEEPPPAQG